MNTRVSEDFFRVGHKRGMKARGAERTLLSTTLFWVRPVGRERSTESLSTRKGWLMEKDSVLPFTKG